MELKIRESCLNSELKAYAVGVLATILMYAYSHNIP